MGVERKSGKEGAQRENETGDIYENLSQKSAIWKNPNFRAGGDLPGEWGRREKSNNGKGERERQGYSSRGGRDLLRYLPSEISCNETAILVKEGREMNAAAENWEKEETETQDHGRRGSANHASGMEKRKKVRSRVGSEH